MTNVEVLDYDTYIVHFDLLACSRVYLSNLASARPNSFGKVLFRGTFLVIQRKRRTTSTISSLVPTFESG
jgi:hypothetical protein